MTDLTIKDMLTKPICQQFFIMGFVIYIAELTNQLKVC